MSTIVPLSDFTTALKFVALALVAKQIVSKVLLIRTRLQMDKYNWPEDQPGLALFAPLFKLLLVAIPMTEKTGGDQLERYNALTINSAENETYFIIAAAVYGSLVTGSLTDIYVLYFFLGARYLHAFAFITKFEPFRTFSYVFGLLATVYFLAMGFASLKI